MKRINLLVSLIVLFLAQTTYAVLEVNTTNLEIREVVVQESPWRQATAVEIMAYHNPGIRIPVSYDKVSLKRTSFWKGSKIREYTSAVIAKDGKLSVVNGQWEEIGVPSVNPIVVLLLVAIGLMVISNLYCILDIYTSQTSATFAATFVAAATIAATFAATIAATFAAAAVAFAVAVAVAIDTANKKMYWVASALFYLLSMYVLFFGGY